MLSKMKTKKITLISILTIGLLVSNSITSAQSGFLTPGGTENSNSGFLSSLGLNLPESNMLAAASDTTYPSDVENVKATAGDKKVTLTWDAATDNVGVVGYKIFYGNQSVSTDTASYTMGPVDIGNVTTFDITNLENDKTYYFAITAVDAAGNESEFYSNETSATPKSSGSTNAVDLNDNVAPKVVSVDAENTNKVKVVFSEAVKLPASNAESTFSIKEDFLGIALAISKVELDSSDSGGKTVILTTANQKAGTKYMLTAGIQIQDLAGNPIISGTSDTAVFTGTDAKAQDLKPAADSDNKKEGPSFVNVKALDGNTVEVTFSKPVVLLPNANENFIITDASDNSKIINVTKVVVAPSGAVATLTTEDLSNAKFNIIAIKVKDLDGNLMDVQNSATSFDGVAPSTPDLPIVEGNVKPTNAASDLLAKMVSDMLVNLSWKINTDQVANAANFVLYMSTDKGVTYGPGIELNTSTDNYNFNDLKEDMIYYFKLTTRDNLGNESEGIETTFILPKTGPELGLLLLGSGGFGAFFTRKNKKNKK